MGIIEHNRQAWDAESASGSEWATPVDSETIRKASEGDWQIVLTPRRAVPAEWFGDLFDKAVLCLGSGGGQQAPVLAAVGANVTSFDLSDNQLTKDARVAEEHGLSVRCVQGDMADLSDFADDHFDLVFHPVSNLFVPDVQVVWRECHRVLKPNGILLAGFMNPSFFLFDHEEAAESGCLVVKHVLPYAEPGSLEGKAHEQWSKSGRPAEFSHSLESQIGGQIAAGFGITALYEDHWDDEATPLNKFSPMSIATRAVKLASGF
ncbi:MAG: SAM-dependent methyltransferase [Verrucomicrobiales bacterium]|jgi:SAM-dependent methyltransferase